MTITIILALFLGTLLACNNTIDKGVDASEVDIFESTFIKTKPIYLI